MNHYHVPIPQAGSNLCVCGLPTNQHLRDAGMIPPADVDKLIDQLLSWKELAEDLWDDLMAWHYDDCPFPDTPVGTADTACTCHIDMKARWDEVDG